MADAALLVRKYLLQNSELIALLGGNANRIVCGELPEYADPNAQSPWTTISSEGGKAHSEVPVTADRVKLRVWTGINQYLTAHQVDNEIFLWLHGKNGIDLSPDGFIIIIQQTVRGQDLTDPDNGWATVLSWYEITSHDSNP